MAEAPILETRGLSKTFVVKRNLFGRAKQTLRALKDVNVRLERGEVLGLVGESGCGKSTFARVALRLHEPTTGQVLFDGTDITKQRQKELIKFRRKAQIIFQDPYSSLNPRMTIGQTLREVLIVHKLVKSRKEAREKSVSLLERVGLAADTVERYPHAFSGGQRQRIGIARALAVNPELIVADEAVSALDVSIQAQIINLLSDLKEQVGLSYVFISHDLRVVHHLSNRVAVMYLGSIVEQGPTEALYSTPKHPYTRALLDAVPIPDPTTERKRLVIAGEIPNPISPPPGCTFHPRCPIAEKGLCDVKVPELRELTPGHFAACHLAS